MTTKTPFWILLPICASSPESITFKESNLYQFPDLTNLIDTIVNFVFYSTRNDNKTKILFYFNLLVCLYVIFQKLE